ncbi:hypothetical protein FOA52_015645, partial [Chlamydomonas sp. UWO 241]
MSPGSVRELDRTTQTSQRWPPPSEAPSTTPSIAGSQRQHQHQHQHALGSRASSRAPSVAAAPSHALSEAPSHTPSRAPSARAPYVAAASSRAPSEAPSRVPSAAPSRAPSVGPSCAPSVAPSRGAPSVAPSVALSVSRSTRSYRSVQSPQLGSLEFEVAHAYAPWLQQKKAEVLEYFSSADTPSHYKQYMVQLFQQLDRAGDGCVTLEDLLAWARDKHGSKGSVHPAFIARQFRRVDLDGRGELNFDECLLLQYLGALNMTWCSGCSAFIDSETEDGWTCTACYGKCGVPGKGCRQHDVCMQCFDAGVATEHTKLEGEPHQFVRMSEICAPETVTCVCCQREHAMVAGYMLGADGDRHVRPVGEDGDGWVCELCALQLVQEEDGDGWVYKLCALQ